MTTSSRSIFRIALPLVLLLLLGACATPHPNPRDPWEGFNRPVFRFNDGLDRAVIKPVAKGYDWLVPANLQVVIGNFFANLSDLYISLNNLLQGKPKEAGGDLARVLINSSLGIGGLVDAATGMGFEKHDEDFGQTLAVWGVESGPFVMLPVIGPRTVRDSFSLAADWEGDPLSWVKPDLLHYSLSGLHQVDKRASLLPGDKVIEAGAIDKYSYIRDAYLQHRRYEIYDGAPPPEDDEK